jgi:uncharacterized membrane protein
MKTLSNVLMKGLATVLPIALTVYAILWLLTTAESVMHRVITLLLPGSLYWPGLGIVAGLVLLFAIGSAVNAYLVRRALAVWDRLLARIPVVKTVYGAIRDMTRLLPSGDTHRDLQSVVLWRTHGAFLLGFVTRDSLPEFAQSAGDHDLVAVYVPLSYMIGGVTLYLPRGDLVKVDMPVENAMRLAITGGMSAMTEAAPAAADAPVRREA